MRLGNHWHSYPWMAALLLATAWSGVTPEALAAPPAEQVPFVANDGQLDSAVRFYARTFGGTVFATETGDVVYSLFAPDGTGAVLRETFARSGPASVTGMRQATVKVSSFRGNDQTMWRSGLPTYEALTLGEIRPGIEVRLQACDNNVEKLFLIQPGASPRKIRVGISGAEKLRVGSDGKLVVVTGGGTVAFTKPVAFQEIDGARTEVPVRYEVEGDEYGFAVGEYDAGRELVIDPLLASTLLGGGSNDSGRTSSTRALAANGDVLIVGYTQSADFPTTPGAHDTTHHGGLDVFVARFDATLNNLIAATYLGGALDDGSRNGPVLALDDAGSVYVAGNTMSTDFPTTTGAFSVTYGGVEDVFVAKLDGSLQTLLAATYLGGSSEDRATCLTLDGSSHLYVGGLTRSADFPTSAGAFDTTYSGIGTYGHDIFITRLDANLTSVAASTYVGGPRFEEPINMVLEPGGTLCFSGHTMTAAYPTTAGCFEPTFQGGTYDGVITRLSGDLTTLLASTFLGGSTGWDFCYGMGLAANGDICVTGHTGATDFPTTVGAFATTYSGTGGSGIGDDAFVTRLEQSLGGLVASTYLGGAEWEIGHSLVFDANGNVFVAGTTSSPDFPVTPGALKSTYEGSNKYTGDGFVAKLDAALTSLEASTYFGGSGNDNLATIIMAPGGALYLVGGTTSPDFPTTPGAYDESFGGGADIWGGDLFVSKIDASLLGPLHADTAVLPASTGGSVNFTLEAGPHQANRGYLLLAGLSGTSPGTPLGGSGATLPLNIDAFTLAIYPLLNTPTFADFSGVLDASGNGCARLDTFGPLSPGAVGVVVTFAYGLGHPWNFGSNPVSIEIVP